MSIRTSPPRGPTPSPSGRSRQQRRPLAVVGRGEDPFTLDGLTAEQVVEAEADEDPGSTLVRPWFDPGGPGRPGLITDEPRLQVREAEGEPEATGPASGSTAA